MDADTFQGQLDEKIAFIEKLYAAKHSPFMISEDISPEEALNTAGITYLYTHSPIYRQMTERPDFQRGYGDGTFSQSSDQALCYERFVFSVGMCNNRSNQ